MNTPHMKTIKRVEVRASRVKLGEESAVYGAAVTDSRGVARIASALLSAEDQEVVVAFLLDTKNRVQAYAEVARGGINSCTVSTAQVFRAAIMIGANAIVVAHNHPSGDPAPSEADTEITHRLRAAGVLLDVQLLDHVIVAQGGGAYFSYLDSGMLP